MEDLKEGEEMDISVVIPFYNNVDWLYDAINSIKEESDLEYEIIVVNDGSKEEIDTNKIINNKKRIRIIKQYNQGAGSARNTGISASKGEYIAFLDSDDLFVINKMTKQISFMKKNDFIWSHSSYIKFYENGKEELVDNSSYKGVIFPKCLAYNPIATPTVMVRKDALENPKKRFSKTMKFGEDGFMWCQLSTYYSVGVVPEPLSRVRMRGTNATLSAKNHLYVKSEMFKYINKGSEYFNGKKIPIFLKLIFGLADFNYKLLEFLFYRNNNKPYVEIFAKVLYSTQYFALRIYKFKKNKHL